MSRIFQRIAIINRGDPAMRLIRAVREWNCQNNTLIRTLAFFTDPDRHAMFVREADEAFCLGSPMYLDPKDHQRKSSYLDYSRLEEGLRSMRADAAWVGWGFVAEHPEFADLCARLGVTFIGPSGSVMRQLGDKIASKILAESADVPVSPWSGAGITSLQEAEQCAARLGFPVMVKATAGGGGRGIRKVTAVDGLREALESARAEALKAFGDETIFIEKMVTNARHIEVQILGDSSGTIWPVGIRDCSVQRRNQKVIEEGPCPILSESTAVKMKEAAVRLARRAQYTNAGTVEFLYQPESDQFFFMEMNTRLQVEHPVTEMTTGVDLVKMQLHIAAGGTLSGACPPTVGHAIEVRLNAEDPSHDFAPSPGTAVHFRLPTGPGLRVDTGLAQGDTIPAEFDSMIAKIIAYGKDREEALARLTRGLLESGVTISGGTSNKSFLMTLLAHPDVRNSAVDIGWLDRLVREGIATSQGQSGAEVAILAAALAFYDLEMIREREIFLSSALHGRPKLREENGLSLDLQFAGQTYQVLLYQLSHTDFSLRIDQVEMFVSREKHGAFDSSLSINGDRHRLFSTINGTNCLVEHNGGQYTVSSDNAGLVRAPATAVVLSVAVREGETVQVGQRLMSVEAMKTETSINAPCNGSVKVIHVSSNMQVNAGAPLVVIEPVSAEGVAAIVERISFEKLAQESSQTVQPLQSLAQALLGFDVPPRFLLKKGETSGLFGNESFSGNPFVVLVDLLALFQEPVSTDAGERPAEEILCNYLRNLSGECKLVATSFQERLKRVFAHYGLESFARTLQLEESLLLMHRAFRRLDRLQEPLMRMLSECSAQLTQDPDGSVVPLLDQMILVGRIRLPALVDLAAQIRYRLFEQPLFAEQKSQIFKELHSKIEQLSSDLAHFDYEGVVSDLADQPTPVIGYLLSKLPNSSARSQQVILQILLSHYYREESLKGFVPVNIGCHLFVLATKELRERKMPIVAAWTTLEALKSSVESIQQRLVCESWGEEGVLDLFLPQSVMENGFAEQFSQILNQEFGKLPIRRVTMVLSDERQSVKAITFQRDKTTQFVEDKLLRGLHPADAKRLEFWRLSEFELDRLVTSQEDVIVFQGVAKANPKDKRLFAFAEVRDLTPIRSESGRVAELPHFQRLFISACNMLREILSRSTTRDRPAWNRITFNIVPVMTGQQREFFAIAKKLQGFIEGLNLEKVVIRAWVADKRLSKPQPIVFEVSYDVHQGIRVAALHARTGSIQTLNPYEQNVIRMRNRSSSYAYEIIRMLTPTKGAEQSEFPPGNFVEYDLESFPSGMRACDHFEASQVRLVPIERVAGQSQCNVVVGILSNVTVKVPEGLKRVLIVSDATRDLGSLAEPECLRILGALELATRNRLPIDWFPVSSGASISMTSGTENLDWTARVLRGLIEFTQAGGEINLVVDDINVGAQSYWNAESTMLMHTKGILIMTPRGSMVLTGKRALDYSGGVSAENNQGIGGAERIMGPNAQAQYLASNLMEACQILLRHHEHNYIVPGESRPRVAHSNDEPDRDICLEPHRQMAGISFTRIGEIFSSETNPDRKKPFDMRAVMQATIDRDLKPMERMTQMHSAETGIVWDAHIGGYPVCLLGIESRPIVRLGQIPNDGPDSWSGGTLFPLSSKKLARAINSASGKRPVIVLANLSGFDGSPESMRNLQLEYGAELGRAVVNCQSPILFCVLSRFHGGAYVVFSRALNPRLRIVAIEGAFASVIGGVPAAAVVFPGEVKAKTNSDPRIVKMQDSMARASEGVKGKLYAEYQDLFQKVYAEKQSEVAKRFDEIHNIERARAVGSIDDIIPASRLRPYIIASIEASFK